MNYEYHEIANEFTILNKENMDDLITSIKKQGLIHPITLFEDKILDGRNRYQACISAEVKPKFTKFTGTVEEAVDYVIGENVNRRHLTSSQRAIFITGRDAFVARVKASKHPGARSDLTSSNELEEVNTKSSDSVIANEANTNSSYVSQATKIRKESPELTEHVKNGRVSLPDATKIIKLDPEVQMNVISDIETTDKPKIKDIIKDRKAEARKINVDNYISDHEPEVKSEPIYLSACADINLPENSIDLIFTDPPYSPDFTSVYGDLAKLAAKVLKPGCFCIAYAGDMYMPNIIDLMSPHLEWVMILNQYMPNSDMKAWRIKTTTVIRHLIVFKKPGKTENWNHVINTVQNMNREKSHHIWEQGEYAAAYYIPAYTNVGDTVLDPFVGGGTFPAVCKKIGREYIGYDIDQDAVNTTLKRLTDETDT